MRSKVKKVLVTTAAILAIAALVLVGRAKWLLGRSWAEAPEPEIAADTSPAGVARGEVIFQSLCIECHAGKDGVHATGKRLDEIPSFLGTFWSANLAHPEHGVHTRSDGKIARALRTGVLPDGRFSLVMSGFSKLGDQDLAALLGYLRSKPPALEPGGEDQPRSEPSLAAAILITYVGGGVTIPAKGTKVATPAKAVSVEYGAYMTQVMDCVGCHTDGFAADKEHDPNAFAGGFELKDPTGAPIFTKNITFDEETGIGRWSVEDFERAVTRGVHPAGHTIRKPMPLFSRLDRTDVEAIYAYLRTVKPVRRANKEGGQPVRKAKEGDRPEELFVALGCAACHGAGAPYEDKLRGAIGKDDAAVASWILDPQATKPGTAMPSFQGVVDPEQAKALARYAKERAAARGPVSSR